MMELTPGLELGARFVLVRRLGRGGTSEVWLAEDAARGERVALKVVDESSAPEPGLAARIAGEVARAQSLGSRFAVPIHGIEQVDGRTLVVMEFQEGGDLGQFRGRSFESWQRPVEDVVAALAAAHAQGLVHRDLKCSNVLLDGTGRARLADFGLAGLAGSLMPAGGSPYNASPQQLRGEAAQPADDLYALGALLYELIAGHPPFYPEITRDRVLFEPVPPLLPRGTVPVGVRELCLRLLAKSPRERPASMAEVRERLAVLPDEEDSLVVTQPPVLAGAAAQAPRGKRRWLPAALLAAAAGAAVVFIWLPSFIADRNAGIEREARAAADESNRQRQLRAQQAADSVTARAAAEAARVKFDAAFVALDARAAARWATDAFVKARTAGEQAAQRFAVGDYAAAREAWESSAAQLAELDKRRPQALQEALERGQAALAQGKTGAAREAFQFALAIEPDHAGARAGIDRAARLDQAFPIVDTAIGDERAGRLAEAEENFRKALALDAAAPGAREGLARLAARRAGDAYAAAMSRGLADLAAGRAEPARAALQQALALRPGSKEARDALASLDQGQRAAALRLLEARASSAESDERWQEALAAWQEAAALEPGLAPVREGVARSQPRAELQRRIDALIQQPERLWDPAGRGEARTVLAMAASAGNPRLRLAASARELERLAAAAETPVRLRLESDEATSVAIYRVGQYGAFATREVELLPGRYTVVGTRAGFRDVRREVVLAPGTPPSAVVVKCEEPI
jgi:hypothetical protein